MVLIDKEKTIKAIEDLQDCYNGFSDTYDKACIIGVIDEIPVVDAVPVVRCGECEFWGKDLNCPICNSCRPELKPNENFFCKDGKRRTE